MPVHLISTQMLFLFYGVFLGLFFVRLFIFVRVFGRVVSWLMCLFETQSHQVALAIPE